MRWLNHNLIWYLLQIFATIINTLLITSKINESNEQDYLEHLKNFQNRDFLKAKNENFFISLGQIHK